MSLNLVLDYESSALSAPQSFRDGMQTAVNMLDSAIKDNITVTIQVGYDDWDNGQITGLGSGAVGGDLDGSYVSYSTLRSALAGHETSSTDQTFVNSLPNANSVNGVSSLYVPSAIEKALGMISPTDLTVDGAIGMGSSIPTSDLVGVALHELTHAMGREPNSGPFNLGRYTSAGARLFSTGSTAPPAYFSIDGGLTKLADYGQDSDPSDFLSTGVQGGNDPFNEYYGNSTSQSLSAVDLQLLDTLGFNVTAATTPQMNGAPFDFSGTGTSDVLLFNSSGSVIDWMIQNGSYQSYNFIGNTGGYSIAGAGNFDGSRTSDILLTNTSGSVIDWMMSNGGYTGFNYVGNAQSYGVVGTGDFTGNGTSDVLLENAAGNVIDWLLSNGTYQGNQQVGNAAGYGIVGTGDFDGNGTTDVLLENSHGGVVDWMMSNGTYQSYNYLGSASGYGVVGEGDFSGNGSTDILLENSSGNVIDWMLQNGQLIGWNEVGSAAGYGIVGTGDYGGNGISDVLLENANKDVIEWTMQAGTYSGWHQIGNAASYSIGHA